MREQVLRHGRVQPALGADKLPELHGLERRDDRLVALAAVRVDVEPHAAVQEEGLLWQRAQAAPDLMPGYCGDVHVVDQD